MSRDIFIKIVTVVFNGKRDRYLNNLKFDD